MPNEHPAVAEARRLQYMLKQYAGPDKTVELLGARVEDILRDLLTHLAQVERERDHWKKAKQTGELCPQCGHETITSSVEMDSFELICDERDQMERQRDAAEAEVARLRAYVQHKDDCAAWPQFTSHFQQAAKVGACTCGLDTPGPRPE